MMANKTFIFDYDSTFIQSESFDELLHHVLKKSPENEKLLEEFHRNTELTMSGKFSFHESLDMRIKAAKLHHQDIEAVAEILKNKISPSFLRNKSFFEQNVDHIYIFSGGFVELIWPVVKNLGIKYEHIYANRFLYDHEGHVVDYDRNLPACQDQGKVIQLKMLNLKGDILVIGDGYNDYEMKEAGLAHSFFCYTENVNREAVANVADGVFEDLEGIFLACNIDAPKAPKPKKALLLENIHPYVEDHLKSRGFLVETKPQSLNDEELIEALDGVSLLGIRSKTAIKQNVLDKCPSLDAIGAFCIGTNHIDVKGCLNKGIAVFNAPFSNTRSVVEMALAEIIMLFRRLHEKNHFLHQGQWQKSANQSYEVRGKTLGIIGYGNIGSQLSILAEDLGMNVIFYDIEEKLPLGNAKSMDTMKDVLELADIVSLHVDGRASNRNLIDEQSIEHMKDNSYLINLSRGFVVELEALKHGLESGKILGAALDVYPEEPEKNQDTFNSLFKDMPQVILTPHIGGSTKEAQFNIGQFVASRLQEYSLLGSTLNCVNLPQLQLPAIGGSHRIIHIHENVPGILAKINSLFATHNVNIEGQYLKTNESIGYVITDINALDGDDFVQQLSSIEHTIKVRVLY